VRPEAAGGRSGGPGRRTVTGPPLAKVHGLYGRSVSEYHLRGRASSYRDRVLTLVRRGWDSWRHMTEEEAQQSEETPVSETVTEPSDAVTETIPEAPAEEAPSAEATAEEVPSADAPAEEVLAVEGSSEEGSSEAEVPAASPGVVEVDAVIDGVVQRITPYGAFIQLPGGKLGLIHISEIDRNYVKDVHDHLREGDTIQAKILAIKEDGKIDLSIKALQDPQPRMERRRGNDPGFEQMLRKFLRSSEERQVDVKRSVMHKRK